MLLRGGGMPTKAARADAAGAPTQTDVYLHLYLISVNPHVDTNGYFLLRAGLSSRAIGLFGPLA